MTSDSNNHRPHLPAPPPTRPNSALCAGAPTRILWAALALALLWATIHWALS